MKTTSHFLSPKLLNFNKIARDCILTENSTATPVLQVGTTTEPGILFLIFQTLRLLRFLNFSVLFSKEESLPREKKKRRSTQSTIEGIRNEGSLRAIFAF